MKKLLLLLIVLCNIVILAGCESPSTGIIEGDPDNTPSQEETILSTNELMDDIIEGVKSAFK